MNTEKKVYRFAAHAMLGAILLSALLPLASAETPSNPPELPNPGILMIQSLTPPMPPAVPTELIEDGVFPDIAGHWANDYIIALADKGIINGKGDGRFDPNGPLTRAELSKLLKDAYFSESESEIESLPFSDVPRNNWQTEYVAVMIEKGVINGMPDGMFYPNKPVTRGEGIKMLLIAANLAPEIISANGDEYSFGTAETIAPPPTPQDYDDVPTDSWYYPYIKHAKLLGLTEPVEIGEKVDFNPDKPMTRAEIAKLLMVALDLPPNPPPLVIEDLPADTTELMRAALPELPKLPTTEPSTDSEPAPEEQGELFSEEESSTLKLYHGFE
jgi:hypothetical protein